MVRTSDCVAKFAKVLGSIPASSDIVAADKAVLERMLKNAKGLLNIL
jgi:hypothetical protein